MRVVVGSYPELRSAFRGETRDSLIYYLHGTMPITGANGAGVLGKIT